jgi:hypothetical protein
MLAVSKPTYARLRALPDPSPFWNIGVDDVVPNLARLIDVGDMGATAIARVRYLYLTAAL